MCILPYETEFNYPERLCQTYIQNALYKRNDVMPLHDPLHDPLGVVQLLLVLGKRVKKKLVKNKMHFEIFSVFEITREKSIKVSEFNSTFLYR